MVQWLKDVCNRPNVDYIFHNAQYDLAWLRTLEVEIQGRVNDISVCDALLDEEQPDGYSLNSIALRWVGEGKDETLLAEAAANYGITDLKKDMWKLPASLVGPYAEQDARITLGAWLKLKDELVKDDVWKVYCLERELTPILFDMHWRGIRVDTAYADQLNDRWWKRERELMGFFGPVDIWSAAEIAKLCDHEGISYPRTAPTKNFPNGQPSITKAFLASVKHPKLDQLQELRAINRVRSVYLEQNLITNVVNGRIHPQYVQMASDEGGTRTMRLACKNPNAQQFPKRSRLFDAKSLRKCLIPEDGCEWAKFDYWSQEPVIQCHYGLIDKLPGAEEVRQQFIKGVKLYTFVEEATHGRCNYDDAKQVALARTYGMGKPKLALDMGISLDQASELLDTFDQTVPYIALLARSVSQRAATKGFIRNLLGHKRRFNLWEVPRNQRDDPNDTYPMLPLEKAQARWPKKQLERAQTYKAFNALCQGGAAAQTKKALVEIKKAVGLPGMTVHDEISRSILSAKEADTMEEIMVHCIPLRAPVRADRTIGATWS